MALGHGVTSTVQTEGHRSHQRVIRLSMAVSAVSVCLVIAGSPATADATSLQQARSEAAQVMAKLDRLQTDRSAALGRERTAERRAAAARAALTASRLQIDAAQASLARARDALAAALVTSYKGRADGGVDYVLLAGSFADLVDRVDLLRRVASDDRALIGDITATTTRLRQEQAVAEQAAADARKAVADARAARADLDRSIAGQTRILGGLNARIADLISKEKARRAALATSGGATPPASGGGGASGGGAGGGSGTGGGGGGTSGNVFYGEATWYGPGFAGQPTASGEIFDPNALTCASPWLPFGTQLHVTNLATGLSVDVRVNDRGPFGRGVLDLSAHAAQIVALSGWQQVRIQILSGPRAARALMP
jgi:peptidoglycan hydrolase CwlO-like protein